MLTCFHSFFGGYWRPQKSHFEINWPLAKGWNLPTDLWEKKCNHFQWDSTLRRLTLVYPLFSAILCKQKRLCLLTPICGKINAITPICLNSMWTNFTFSTTHYAGGKDYNWTISNVCDLMGFKGDRRSNVFIGDFPAELPIFNAYRKSLSLEFKMDLGLEMAAKMFLRTVRNLQKIYHLSFD